MIHLNEEYFQSPYYFYLKDKGDKIAVYFAVGDTLTESRKNDEVVVVDKEVFKEIQKVISSILKSNKKLSKDYIHKLIDSRAKSKQQPDGEIGELVNPDGSVLSSNIPILNQRNLAKKTMDQTVRMTKSNQFPFIRVYYGESEEVDGKFELNSQIEISTRMDDIRVHLAKLAFLENFYKAAIADMTKTSELAGNTDSWAKSLKKKVW